MQAEQIVFDSEQISGTRSYGHWWRNAYSLEIPPRGWILLVHGMGEYGTRYAELAQFFCRLGFDVFAPDLPGYGFSAQLGSQRDCYSVEVMLQELKRHVENFVFRGPLARKGIAKSPWFLCGHSLGALLILNWIVEGKASDSLSFDFASRAFVSAPPLATGAALPKWKQVIANGMLKWAPELKVPSGVGPELLSSDGIVSFGYRSDPLIRDRVNARQLDSLLKSIENVWVKSRDIEIPLMLAQGDADPIVNARSVEDFYQQLGTHKKYLSIPGARHEILNEVNRSLLYREIAGWFLS